MAGAVRIVGHARKRCAERRVSERDILGALRKPASAWRDTERPDRWHIMGTDTDGDALELVVEFEEREVIIITVM